jgi:hypothetical protein
MAERKPAGLRKIEAAYRHDFARFLHAACVS